MEVQRISNTVQKFNGESYYSCGQYFQRKGRRLHREVWQYHNGEIPKGYHVHHKDGDRANNDISNLELLFAGDHLSQHMNSEERREQARKNVQKAIAAAPKWHKSEAGRAWHAQHAKEVWEEREPQEITCVYCGKKYSTLQVRQVGNHFCSNNCKSAYRRRLGVDNEERICAMCGAPFVTNKYSKIKYCGRDCARKARWGVKDA